MNHNRVTEIELKLAGDADALATVFREVGGVDSDATRIVSTYYDTADRRLWGRGFTFRLRSAGNGHELTLKDDSGLMRGEWTAPVDGPVADLARLPPSAPQGELGVASPELEPILTCTIERRSVRLTAGRASVEVSLDTGTLLAGERQARVADLEFELLGGPVEDMLNWVRTLLPGRALFVHTCSKAARGMALRERATPAYRKAATLHLQPDDTIDWAIRQIVGAVATQILSNMPFVTDEHDPEGVHQVRVALRRLRVGLGLFREYVDARAALLSQEANTALKQLGPARDLDALISQTLRRVGKHGDGGPDLGRLEAVARQRIVGARSAVRSLVADPRFNGFVIELLLYAHGGGPVRARCDSPLGGVAVTLLDARHRKLLATGRKFAGLTDRQRHQVRIAVKHLRYACDFLQGLIPGDLTAAYIKRLARLQKRLGRFNDLVVVERVAAETVSGGTDLGGGSATEGGRYRHSRRAVERRLVREWNRLTRTPPFWRELSAPKAPGEVGDPEHCR